MTCFKGVQRQIALLACGLLAACAIDSRPSRLSPDEIADSDDPEEAAASTQGGSSSERAGAEPGQGPGVNGVGNDTETGVAPLLPPSGGAGGATGDASGQGSPVTGISGSSSASGSPGQGSGGTQPGAGVPPAPVTEPEVIGGCFNQLLRNGDFERGREGWTETSALRDVIVWRDHPDLAPTGVTPQAGNYLAWIGGVPNGDFTGYPTRLQQEVQIPAEAQSLTFSGYLWASQTEPGRMPFDWAILELADPDPESRYLWRVQYFADTVTEGWTYFEVSNTEEVARFAGKTVPVQTFNAPDGNGLLSVWLDSLRLEARCPR